MNCARDVMPFFIGCRKRSAKEVTESFGLLENARDAFGDLRDWVIISVGDGKRPRTGSAFRFATKAHWVHSIDPETDVTWFEKTLPEKFDVRPRSFSVHKNFAHELRGAINCEGKKTLVIQCHSHAATREALDVAFNYASLSLIEMPCCKKLDTRLFDKALVKEAGLETYSDGQILSGKNQIYIWRDASKITSVLKQPKTKKVAGREAFSVCPV